MWSAFIIVLNIFLVAYVDAGYFSAKCVLSDSDCITKTAQDFVPAFTAGIPSIGLETSEPLFIPYVDASNSVLKLILRDVHCTGFTNTTIKRIRFDEAKSTASLKIVASINLESQYEISGKLLLLPLKGKDALHVKIRKMELTTHFSYKEVPGKDGKLHWHFEYKSHSYSLKDKCYVEFEGLFHENAFLAQTTKDVIAQNGNEIILEVGGPVIKAVIDAIIVRANQLFAAVSVDEARALQ